jgi:hypothetical protein
VRPWVQISVPQNQIKTKKLNLILLYLNPPLLTLYILQVVASFDGPKASSQSLSVGRKDSRTRMNISVNQILQYQKDENSWDYEAPS